MKVNWEQKANSYLSFLERHRHIINIVVLIVTALSVWATTKLDLRTDFSELLPERLPSVKALNEIKKRIGGTARLTIGVESPSFEANKKFVETFAPIAKEIAGESLQAMEYRFEDVQNYLETYGLHYLTLPKLKEVRDKLQSEIDAAEDQLSGLGGEDKPSTQKKEDWIDSFDPRFRKFLTYRDAYLSTNEGKILVIALRLKSSSLNVSKSEKLVAALQAAIDKQQPSSFHPEMKVNLAGSTVSAIQEFHAIQSDITDTALLLVALTLAVIVLFFWSIRSLILIIANLTFPVAWTFGLTDLHIGYLTTQTAFMGSLVVGTGINYGIIFLMRYLEEIRKGTLPRSAILYGLQRTTFPTLAAALGTSLSFLTLLVAQNRGLSQFGFIGSLGIILCWMAAYSLLPLWILQFEGLKPSRAKPHPLGAFSGSLIERFGSFLETRSKILLSLCLIASIGASYGVYKLSQNSIEYDFNNLRNRVAQTKGAAAVEDRINKVFSGSSTPALVLLSSRDQSKEICDRVREISKSLPEEKNIIESCLSLDELLPPLHADESQDERKVLFSEIKDLLHHTLLRQSKHRDVLEGFKAHLTFDRPNLDLLPHTLQERFRELNGDLGKFAFVYPNSDKPLDDGRNLVAFTESLTDISLPKTQSVVSAAGDSFILADLLDGLKKDAPVISFLSFVLMLFLTLTLAGGWRATGVTVVCLGLGAFWMLAWQGFIGWKFNFFNFIALPLTFGIAVDYPINLFTRYKEEGFQNYGKVLRTTGTAVILASLTTIIGYYTLLDATNQALVSFAHLALLGEFTCLFSAVCLLPLLVKSSRKA